MADPTPTGKPREVRYRGYVITYWAKPIPTNAHDYDYAHEDWDLGDPRIGAAASLAEAKADIDALEEEFGADYEVPEGADGTCPP